MVQWRAFKIHRTWPLHCRFFRVKNVPQIIQTLFTLRKIIILGTCHWNVVWGNKNSGPMARLRHPIPPPPQNCSSLLKSCDRSQISLTLMMSKKMTFFARPHRVWHYWWCSLILCFTEEKSYLDLEQHVGVYRWLMFHFSAFLLKGTNQALIP